MAILEVENLRSKYSASGPEILKGISFEVDENDFFAIIGPSGAGKSTLIRGINRLIEPTSGDIRLDGTDMLSLNAKSLRRMRRHIGMIFQEFNLINRMSVMDNGERLLVAVSSPWTDRLLRGCCGHKADVGWRSMHKNPDTMCCGSLAKSVTTWV